MAYHITPSLGININYVGPLPWYDGNFSVPSPALGTVVKATDGHDYIWAKASAAVASNVAVVLTEPAMTVATGAGSWTSPTITGGVPIDNYAWFKRTAI